MSRIVSFVVLIAVIVLVTAVFFRVMMAFLVPMFLAAVLVVVFRPVHQKISRRMPTYPRVAAGLTTAFIGLVVFVPCTAIVWNSYVEVRDVARDLIEGRGGDTGNYSEQLDEAIEGVLVFLHEKDVISVKDSVVEETRTVRAVIDEQLQSWARGSAGSAALVGARWFLTSTIRIVVGVAIMVISIYYFLKDGPGMLVTIMHLSPLDDRHELQLLQEFSQVSRAVVVATLLSAFVQGALAGVGYYFAGVGAVFFLTGVTMLLAMIPFLGSAAAWGPVCLWLFLVDNHDGANTNAAIGLAVYGTLVVSTIDNVIKPIVLHGRSNLHPLLALLSVLGGVAAMGPIGILVGPMAVSFLQALLGMLRTEIDDLGEGSIKTSLPASGDVSPSGDHAGDSSRAESRQDRPGEKGEPAPDPNATQSPAPSPGKPGKPGKRRTKRATKRRRRS